MTFQAVMAVVMELAVFWDVTAVNILIEFY
jgi:hypothetical protein